MRPSKKGTGKRDREKFAQTVIRALRQAGKTCPIRYDARGFRLLIEEEGGEALPLNLGNAYAEYRAAPPGRRTGALQPYLRAALQVSAVKPDDVPAEEAIRRLLPKVRRRIYYGLADLAGAGEKPPSRTPPYRVLAEHLAVGLVLDFPDCMMEIDGPLLARWGLEADQAFAVARDNLRARSEAPFRPVAPGVFLSSWGDWHDASRIWLAEVLLACQVKGGHVAAVPGPDTLLVTGSEDAAGLKVLFDQLVGALSLPRAISGIPVLLRQGRWAPLELPPGHPEFQRLRLLRLQAEADDYRLQKERLCELRRGRASPHFVATYLTAPDPRTGQVASFCAWAEGLPALLPRAENVSFTRWAPGGEHQVVALGEWERVRSVAGELMTPTGWYPERYRVERFPGPAQLAAIGSAPA